MEALWTSKHKNYIRFDSLQPHYNLVHRAEFERELMDVCRSYGLGVIPYSPLAGGFLSNKYMRTATEPASARLGRIRERYFNDSAWAIHDAVENVALQIGKTPSQVALAWLLTNPLITSPIIGPRNLDQLSDNLGAVGMRLSKADQDTLDSVSSWQED